jgi:hypothetical protein
MGEGADITLFEKCMVMYRSREVWSQGRRHFQAIEERFW